MNYYRRYPGDYARDTAHLSLVQHGAYCLLLDHCYGREAIELPQSIEEAYRICKAISQEEQAAVRYVVQEFFPKRRNGRVGRQLPEEQSRAEVVRARAKKGSAARWGKECSEECLEHSLSNASESPPFAPPKNPPYNPPNPRHTAIPPIPAPADAGIIKKQIIPLSCTDTFSNGEKDSVPKPGKVLLMTCKKGEQWEVPKEKIAEWEESYPDVDVLLTLRGIRQWLKDNPTKRKTPRGMTRFINGWMMREQDKA